MIKEDFIKELTSLKGVGRAKAELLYNYGYDSLDKIQKASIRDLSKIKGLNEKSARDIKNQLKKIEEKQEVPIEKMKAKSQEEKQKKPKEKKEEAEESIIEEKEEKYRVKKKPELSNELLKRLKLRKRIKERTPTFLREEWFRYKRISENWRRPDGLTSKMRINLKYRPSKVRVGFRGPRETRGLHSTGFEEVMVYTVDDLDHIDPKVQAARIGGSVGTKKRVKIEKKAAELEVRILNK